MANQANIVALRAVARLLGSLLDQMVFVGGSTVGLYNTRNQAESRPTVDVDCITEVSPRSAYYALEYKLRALGFRNDQQVICRWHVEGQVVDIMPVAEAILGFSNPWYAEGIAHAEEYLLPENVRIRILPAVYFLATKLAALRNRGMRDIRLSPDWEDIVYVVDNRPELLTELPKASAAVRAYLAAELRGLLRHPELREAIDCALPLGSGGDRPYILETRLVELAESAST